MTGRDTIRRTIRRDCQKAMWLPASMTALFRILEGLMTVLVSRKLGELTDAVFAFDITRGLESLPQLLLCLGISILVVPFVGLLGYLQMLKNALRHDRMVLGRFLDKSYEAVRGLDSGEARQRLTSDANDLRIEWTLTMEKLICSPVILAAVLFFSCRLSVMFTVVVCAVSFARISIPFLVKKREKRYDAEEHAWKLRARTIEDGFGTHPHLARLFGIAEPLIAKYDQHFCAYFKSTVVKSAALKTFASATLSFLDTFCLLVILLIGALLVSVGELSPGAVASMMVYSSLFGTVMTNVSDILRKVGVIGNRIDRLELLYADPEQTGGMNLEDAALISADDLSYCYGEHCALSHLSFTIRRGTKTAICGDNGSGKSTLLSILSGLCRDYRGSLRFNGIELRDCAIGTWRDQFAYVQQDPYLFEGTVRENIRIGNPAASGQEIDAVLHTVGITPLADRQVSAKQNTLSGGEKQKISIARALLKNTAYLIMDEPSNNLDGQTAAWLREYICSSDKTIIFITHDSELAAAADQVIRL